MKFIPESMKSTQPIGIILTFTLEWKMSEEFRYKKLEEKIGPELTAKKVESKIQTLINVGKKRGARYVLTEESHYRRV